MNGYPEFRIELRGAQDNVSAKGAGGMGYE